MYVYTTTLIKEPVKVLGRVANTADLANFDDPSRKGVSLEVDDVVITETAFMFDKTYAQFTALLTGGISWNNVRYIDNTSSVRLYLISNNAL